MTSLANNPKFHDIVVDFVITDPAGELHHVGSFHLSNDAERRACTERFHDCLMQGYSVSTKRGTQRRRAYMGVVGDKLKRAINDHSRAQRA